MIVHVDICHIVLHTHTHPHTPSSSASRVCSNSKKKQVDYAILFGMSIYDAGKSRIAIAQSALEKASENMRAAREKVTSAFHTDSLNTFYDAREAYKAKLNTYLAAMKERGEKLPSTIAQMIASNVTYLREAIVSLKDQPTGMCSESHPQEKNNMHIRINGHSPPPFTMPASNRFSHQRFC